MVKTFVLHLTVDDRDAEEVAEILASEGGRELLVNTLNTEMGGFASEPSLVLVYDPTLDPNA